MYVLPCDQFQILQFCIQLIENSSKKHPAGRETLRSASGCIFLSQGFCSFAFYERYRLYKTAPALRGCCRNDDAIGLDRRSPYSRLDWMKGAGITRLGSWQVWPLAGGGLLYFNCAALYAFYGKITLYGLPDGRATAHPPPGPRRQAPCLPKGGAGERSPTERIPLVPHPRRRRSAGSGKRTRRISAFIKVHYQFPECLVMAVLAFVHRAVTGL